MDIEKIPGNEMWWGTLGTVRPFPDFSPDVDARDLQTALVKKDVATLVRILTNRNNAQRQKVAEAFQQVSQKDLSSVLKKALSGPLEDLMLALIMTPAQFDAHRLRQTMEGMGTDEEGLLEVLCSRTGQQLKDIMVAYKLAFGRYLENDLESETSKDFSKLVMALVMKEERNTKGLIDIHLIDEDVKTLAAAISGKKTDSAPWIQILTTRGPDHLNRVFLRLEMLKGETMEKMVQNHFSGDFKLGLRTLVGCIQNTPLYLAQRLHGSMKKSTIVRGIMVGRSEEDLLCVRREFRKLTNTSLYSTIQKEFKGDLQQALLALCRSEDM
ncbi:annexin A2-like [Clupea harengus]|uniref:Annexin n=1 Tax=Clupea harengus TaxID=7950 RepID=A0A6P8G6L5_CLUHA|nr:annexin A2-like [Clupea harengus]XP_031431736.1 annexin A2-like [Clupea harengus]